MARPWFADAVALGLRLLFVILLFVAAAYLWAGCSTGPQMPVLTTPLTISCTWHAQDGGTATDNDCLIDRSSADTAAQTTGNEVDDVQVSPETDVSVVPGGG